MAKTDGQDGVPSAKAMTPTQQAEEEARRIYLGLMGYLDELCCDEDKKLIEKDIAAALQRFADAEVENALVRGFDKGRSRGLDEAAGIAKVCNYDPPIPLTAGEEFILNKIATQILRLKSGAK